MNRIIVLLTLLILLCFKSGAQLTHGGRGMYVDKFFRTAINTSGQTVVNPVFSILGVPAKEDSLLKFAKENHITYLILYDLRYVFDDPVFEGYLCDFIEKAKTLYCVEMIGAASSCSSLFDNIFSMSATPAISFNDPDYSDKYSPTVQSELAFVEDVHQPGDSMFYLSEATKLVMRAADFNDACAYKIDVIVSEYEFWNASVDDCLGDMPTRDQKYLRYQTLITNMDAIRDNYNSTHPSHQIYVETYLGYLNQNTAYSHQTIANWIDGTYNGKRRVDRINTHYYGTDPSRLYSRTAAGQNNNGYYLTRFLDFCQSTTVNQTNLHPLFSAEYINWGYAATYLGGWFSQGVSNNIFNAEKIFYNDWYDDAQNYHQSTVGSSTLGTMVQPGGVTWFTQSQLNGHLNNPVLFTSNSPVCVATGQNGNFQFQYQGPIEQGYTYKFYLTNPDNLTVRCGSDYPIPWPAYNPATQTAIDLNAALGGCSLPAGDYDAHLELTYAPGCTPYKAPVVRVSIVNSGKIVALTPTTVCQGNPVYLQASSTGSGTTTYAWYDGTSAISGATNSTYAPDANSTGAHNYSCLITSSVGGCSANKSNSIPVTINTFPAATVSTQGTSSCSVTLQAAPSGGTYLWNDGSTGSTYTTSFTGVYSVAVTKNGCTSLSPKYTVSSISGSGNVTPSVSIASSKGNSICAGTTVVFTATPSNGGPAPSFQWKKNGSNVGTNSRTYSTGTLANNDVITCVLTSNLSCASPLTATSNSITMTVSTNVTPAVTIAASPGSAICSGVNVTFSATPVNGGPAPYYQWMKNSVYVGTNSSTFSDNTLVNSDTVKCIMTSTASCPTTAVDTSNKVTISVSSYSTSSVSITANPGNTVCAGTSVVFTATAVNGGATPTYQWKKNGSNIGSNSSTYTSGSLAQGDVITCSMTSSLLCTNPATALSNSISMTVTLAVTPSVTISANTGNSICAGSQVIFTAVPVNGGGGPAYQWKKNGSNVGSNSATYTTSSLVNNDIISCVLTSNANCQTTSTSVSNSITMTVNNNVSPSVSIIASTGNNICSGSSVTFIATPVNGGSTPSCQWKKNGSNVGTNSVYYTTSSLVNNDIITCTITSNANCASPSTATSNAITMFVNQSITPSVSISSNVGTTICEGTNVIFTASALNGGAPPDFQWKINGNNAGGNNSTFTTTSIANNDVVSCVMNSTANCSSPLVVTSNSLSMNVIPLITPSITIQANTGNTICTGGTVVFTATTMNGGATPVYQWKKNGNNVGLNQSVYTDNSISDNDIISCQLLSNMECMSVSLVNSNDITMHVNNPVLSSVSISSSSGSNLCTGSPVTFNAFPVNGGVNPSYQWKRNGTPTGTNSSSYTDNTLTNGDVITCTMTSSESCVVSNPAVSNPVVMTFIPCAELNLRVFIQGYYQGGSKMIAVVDPLGHPTICDTISIQLHDVISPYPVLFNLSDTLNVNGYARFRFSDAVLNHSYFISVKHRNSLETWSDSPLLFNSTSISFDFSAASNRAYGTNMVDLGDGNYGLWSGDVTDGITPGVQDGEINELDRMEIENALKNFLTGYQVTDLTGDGIVESADFSLGEYNFVNQIRVSRP